MRVSVVRVERKSLRESRDAVRSLRSGEWNLVSAGCLFQKAVFLLDEPLEARFLMKGICASSAAIVSIDWGPRSPSDCLSVEEGYGVECVNQAGS